MQLPHYDLHSHTLASDGALAPSVLLQRAKDRGVKVLAITDHDTINGVTSLLGEDLSDINLIVGTELTCLWKGRVLHIVGLNLDAYSSELKGYLSDLSTLRENRAIKICEQLVKMGLPDVYEEAKSLAGTGIIGRPHIAQTLVTVGAVSSVSQVFKKYLGVGKKGDVKMEWPDLSEAVRVIKCAGGIAVLAHPTKYKMTFTKIRSAIVDFIDVGGEAIEVSYPGVTPDHHLHLLRIAENNNLLLSAGSDFHNPGNSWTDIGKYPPLKSTDNHVLSRIL